MVVEAPTEDEEVSASAFLASVKTRLTEWGKEDLYHEFVLALSYDVDVKAVVRILRGHDDLLWAFRRKFAPKADLYAIKAEVEDEGVDSEGRDSSGGVGGPKPPARPPASRLVKQEISSQTPFTPGGAGARAAAAARGTGGDGPRPPPGPPTRGVKRELVKSELVKKEGGREIAPRPPKFAPGAKRGTVTIGDDSDEEEEEEVLNEASISAAVKKGREECIAQLAKLIFRKERATHDAARHRLATVRYATQRSAVPRFPRELFILRGPPGIGKTDYAMQHLLDYAQYEPEDELAARLTHVCAADDFFEKFKGEGASYKVEPGKIESNHHKNEMRVRFAMEAGIHPVYVDCPNVRIWEMKPYLELAERLGYVPTIVEPQEISDKHDDLEFLATSTDTLDRRQRGKVVSKGIIAAFLEAFEPLEDSVADDGALDADPLERIRGANRAGQARLLEPVAVRPPALAALQRKGAKGVKGSGKGKKGAGAYPREPPRAPAQVGGQPKWW